MPKRHSPRHGSMQVWPRKRARRSYARVRSWSVEAKSGKEVKLLGFAGYKAGMTHVTVIDNRKKSNTKGEKIVVPVTVVECPPIRVASIRFYSTLESVGKYGFCVAKEIACKTTKELARKISIPKKADAAKKLADIEKELDKFKYITLIVYTQPKLTGIGKKKPEIFEMHLSGNISEQFAFAKDKHDKEITLEEVFKNGDVVDIHAITKGKGTQGPVKRFGVDIRNHKSEKTKRGPGSLGSWQGQGHMMYRIAYAGQTGYHMRTDYNKKIMFIDDDANKINPVGGFINYGLVKNNYVLIKGSVQGPVKRLIRFNIATRPNKKLNYEAPEISRISTKSRQGR